MTRWDTVRYHDEICVVEEVLDDHLLAVRPYGADGVYVIHDDECERA